MRSNRQRFGAIGVAGAIAFLLGGTAQAAVFDFVALAAGNEGPFDFHIVDGIKLVASAEGPGGDGPAPTAIGPSVPYLDDLAFGDLPAGLGVCSATILGNGQCDPSDDDNVTFDETLRLEAFDLTDVPIEVTLSSILFRDTVHETNFPVVGAGPDPLIDIRVNDAPVFDTFPLTHVFGMDLTGSTFDFRFNNSEFYLQLVTVQGDVPAPGSVLLLLTALAGLGSFRRRARG